MCCEPVGDGQGSDMKFVGHGRGGYEKVPTYNFVGQGAGSYVKEEVIAYQPTLRPRSECICLLLAALIIFFIWVGPHLWGTGGSAMAATEKVLAPLLGTNTAEDVEGSLVVTNLSFDGVKNLTALNGSLAAAVERAIAMEAGLPIQPNQVDATASPGSKGTVSVDFVIKAVPSERVEAVIARLVRARPVESAIASGLTSESSVRAAASGALGVSNFTLTSRPKEANSTEATAVHNFDCDADYTECYVCLRKSWSPEKLSWCCERQNRGCETTTTSVDYDCLEGHDNWRLGWSDVKKEFCCKTEGEGCEDDGNNASDGNATSNSSGNGTNGTNGSTQNSTAHEDDRGDDDEDDVDTLNAVNDALSSAHTMHTHTMTHSKR